MPDVSLLSSYPMIFAALALSGLAFPIPEDLLLLLCGMALGSGTLTWTALLPIALVAVFLRDLASWALGRFFVDRLLASRLGARIPRRRVDEARAFVARRGTAAAFAGRFMAGARVPVFVAAGASGMRVGPFLLFDALGLLITVPLTLALGAAFGQAALEVATGVLQGSGLVWLAAAFVLVAALWLRRGTSGHEA